MIKSLASMLNDKLIAVLNQLLTDSLGAQDTNILTHNHILVEVTDFQLRLLIHCKDTSVIIKQCSQDQQVDSQVQIIGTSTVLMQLAIATDKQQVISTKSGLHIAGDTSALYAWQRAFKSLEINWEAELNEKLGSTPASMVIYLLRSLQNKASKLNQQLPSNLQHMMVTNDLAVETCEFTDHASEVQHTRLETDRLRRKIDNMTAATDIQHDG